MLKKVSPSTKIVLGGPEVTYDAGYWLKRLPEVDVIVMGEGEAVFKDLLSVYSGKQELSAVPGIAYMEDGKLKVHPGGPKLDLKVLPSPFRFKEDIRELGKRGRLY